MKQDQKRIKKKKKEKKKRRKLCRDPGLFRIHSNPPV